MCDLEKKKLRSLNRSLPYVLLLGFLFGTNFVVSRYSLGQFTPIAFVSLRQIIASLIYVLFYLLSSKRQLPRSPGLWLRASVAGVIGIGITMTSFVTTLKYLSSGVTSLFQSLALAVTVLMAAVFLKDEKLTWRIIVGVMVALTGAASLLIKGETGLTEFAQADWRGYFWVGLAVVSASAGNVYAKRFLYSEDEFDVSTIRMIAAALVTFPIAWATSSIDLQRIQLSGYLSLLYMSVVGTCLTFLLYFFINKRFGATAVSQNAVVVPVFATVAGAIFLDERVTPVMVLGMALIFAGLGVLGWRPKEKVEDCVAGCPDG